MPPQSRPYDAVAAQTEAAQAQFSIEDYGRVGDQRPYQVVQPSYPAPKWLQSFTNLEQALRECETLCSLEGRPFRVVRWERGGSGARGGVRCNPCKCQSRIPRFPKLRTAGCLEGFGDATPVAEVQPGGRRIVYDCNGAPKIVGQPDYVVAASPFPRTYEVQTPPQHYLQAVQSAQNLAERTGRRAYVCASFGADCTKRDEKLWIPVVYVHPGSLRERYDSTENESVFVTPVGPVEYKELLAQSRGASNLDQGA